MHQDRCHGPSGAANQICTSNMCEPQVVLIDNLELAVHAEDQVAYYGFMSFNSAQPAKAIDRVRKRDPPVRTSSQFENSGKGNDSRMSSDATASTTEELDEESPRVASPQHRPQITKVVACQHRASTLNDICLSVRPIPRHHSPRAASVALSTAARRQTLGTVHRHRVAGRHWARSRMSVKSEEDRHMSD
ncbi:conserved hypothetical protein [Neospora caninum Liverpool]|uniref:Uncharacterized protein n=1 Tax=Neospora caninum (strain Liverpool) TaxID=572307 RepID=F0VKS7_NEOCL|nr:conserved hypothetical protein [Neospora caninum Liverpool]CBZ54678.1 conserved hypothetical protein [Neospora caninum Liverpool]CEL69394.1 TPA: hypothetical protein BN1204_051050 [Neospora caninum Liverpool]|eukprot:XP_003884708.1 conserved hypothetical protein [Neospora caninum Liverpool]